MQDREEYTEAEITSPAVNTTSVFTLAAIAAKERRYTATADFTAAYLNAKLPEEKLVLMRLGRETASILCLLVPAYKEFLREDGSMVVRLTKALYGCIESANLWYNDITDTLIRDGFERNNKEHCVFNKMVGNHQLTVCLYVDDLFISCADREAIEDLINRLKVKYESLSYSISNKLKYLGLIMDFSTEGEVKLSMPKMVDTIVDESGETSTASTPAGADLFNNEA